MKKILGLVLALVLLVSVLAILPVAAEGDGSYLYLDDGITFVNVSGNTETRIPVAAKEIATKPDANKTVQDCLNDYINGDYPQVTKDIAQALLDYCTAAYDYFSTKSENPYVGTRPNGEPVTDTSDLINAPAPEVIIDDKDDVYLGAALVLDGNMKLRFYFNGNNVNVEHDGNSGVTNADGYCYYDVAVMPFDMDKSVELTVGNTKIKYAPINYLKAKVNDDDLKEIVASIYAYGDAAEKYIREVCQHGKDYIKLDIVKPATLFTTGIANTVCERCGQTIGTEESIGTPTTKHYTSEEHGLFGEKVEISTLLGAGEHFYGEDAKKLYVEFSLLWNPSLENYARENNENYMYMGMFGTANGNSVSGYQTAYHLTFGENCKGFDCTWIGGFEPTSYKYNVGDGPSMQPGNKDNFVYIGNYGWHRIGYEFEQTTDPETGLHTITVHLYVDGTRVSGYKVIRDKDNSYQNLLYTADVVDGEIVYTGDVKSGVYMWAFELANGGKADGDMYFTYADVFVTAGDGFVMPVEKVSNPKYATYTVDTNVSFNASTYFKPVGLDTCAHENTAAGVTTKAPTLFATGEATAICTDCGKTTDGTVTLEKLEGEAVEIFTPSASKDVFGTNVNIVNDVLKGDNFYPTDDNPEGKSLYVEFSILWNETLENVENGKARYVQLGSLGDETGSDDGKRLTPFFIVFNQTKDQEKFWCQYNGGFETDNNKTNIVGPTLYDDVPESDCIFIGDYGWHRIGIKYTQTAENVNGTIEYTLYTSLYIDGVEKLAYKAIYSKHNGANGNIGKKGTENLLYTAEPVGDGVGNYKDIASDRYVFAYRFGESHESNDESAYFVIKDAYITCGTDFVMPVTPIDNPANETFTQDNVQLPGEQHFKDGAFDCDSEIHAWASKHTVDKDPTCTETGSESIKCLVCGEIKPGSSVSIPTTGEHTWDTEYTVDEEATCKPGKESIKCTRCGTIQPGSTQDIPAIEEAHVWPNDYTVVVAPTVFSNGTKTAKCTKCDAALSETIEMNPADVAVFTPNGATGTTADKININENILKGDEFYPTDENPDGKSLYLEFSILWNDTLENVNNGGDKYVQLGALANSGGGERVTPFFLIFNETYKANGEPNMWCQFAGGFETDNNTTNTFGNPVVSGQSPEYYTYIGDYGWHRIGIEYTQVTKIDGNTVYYTLYTALYVDGVKVLEYEAVQTTTEKDKNLLYTATVNNGVVKYNNNTNDRYLYIYRFANNKKSDNENAYFVVGDVSATCGNSFAKPVAPIDPIEGTYSPADGVDLVGDVHFEYRDQSDCDAENHTYTGKYTIDYDATCTTAGQKSYKCEVCGNVKTEAIDAIGHDFAKDYTIDKKATCTEEGQKSKHCSACETKDSIEVIEKLPHTWSDEYVIDQPATCTDSGWKTKHCTVCNVSDGNKVIIEAAGLDHVLAEGFTVTTLPTVFAEGEGIGTCTVCHGENVKSPLPKTEMTLHTYTYTGTGKAEPHYKTGNIGEALGDKQFYPTEDNPDGNSLFLEFSVLLNNTTDILNGEAFGFGHISKVADPNAKDSNDKSLIWDNFSWFHYKAQLRWCNFKGGFDFSEVDKFTYGPVYRESGVADDIVALETYEGWHRMGLQYTQNVYEDANGEFTYDVTVTVYLDGVMVSETIMNWSSLFYSAERDGTGKIVYAPNNDIADYYVVFYNIASGYVKNEGETAYFPFGDFSLTVGDSFAMPVAPVENPKSATFIPALGAAPMDATVHFEHRYQKDCDAENHTYTGKYTIAVAPACGVDGQKSYKCEVCGEVKTEVIPSEQHVWNEGNDTETTDITVATFFSKGVQKGTCRDCGEFDYAPTEKLPATLKTFTNKTSGSYDYKEKLSDVVVGGQDLFVEFSMLFNDSFKKYNGNGAIYLAMIGNSDGSSKKTPYFLTLKERSDFVCKFFGGFESDNNSTSVYIYGPDYATKFPSIADEYGWHRIGLRYHQEATKDNSGNVKYTLSVYLYIDGEYISAFK
ncbi:MAG: hypothetical protein IKV20_02755, partial [Clostridia bacterium]|nr:hypothetical protein [Clostridia bacterium]